MKTVIGTALFNAQASALNNKGLNKSSGNENEVETKTVQSPEGKRPYVSAQSFRYNMRNVLENQFGWNCSPVYVVGNNQAVTEYDPYRYEDDDVFGYMNLNKKKNIRVKRVSPFKCSPLIGLPIAPTIDFGVLKRKIEGDPILFNHQFYSNILKSVFALELDAVGKFTMLPEPGKENLTNERAEEYESEGLKVDDNTYKLSDDERLRRIKDVLRSFNYLHGGAMQTLHLTDLTPKMIILAAINGGNNIFMDVMPHKKYVDGLINLDALDEVVESYQNDFLTNVYVGRFPGFGNDSDADVDLHQLPDSVKNVDLNVTTPYKAIEGFLNELESKNIIEG